MPTMFDNNQSQSALWNCLGASGFSPMQIIRPLFNYTPSSVDVYIKINASSGDTFSVTIYPITSKTGSHVTGIGSLAGRFRYTLTEDLIYEGWLNVSTVVTAAKELVAGQDYLIGVTTWSLSATVFEFGYSGNRYSRGPFVSDDDGWGAPLQLPIDITKDWTFAVYGTATGGPGSDPGTVHQDDATPTGIPDTGLSLLYPELAFPRPPGYDEDYFFIDGQWTEFDDLAGAGGGRYNRQLVVIAHQKVYFEDYV